ncbi:MAG TPA: VWA domain-containing protein [Thermoanaerobaculia bacterium]|nr:VWA domain-containing protein [Thermoanaerobaculia bacterium]
MITFASPLFFLLLLAIPLRVVLLKQDRLEGLGGFEFSSLTILRNKTSLRVLTSSIPLILETIGWVLLVIALARPQRLTSVSSDDRLGLDIVIAIDSSGSMAAEDFRPRNRFAVAIELISEFVDGRVNDRIGIVTFGARAATRVPITFDRDVIRERLESFRIGENGDGTAIGHAIATSVNRLKNSKSRSKVIILVTDGVNNAGSIEPATAAVLAARHGIRIHTIGVGSRDREVPIPVKVQNRFTGEIETMIQYVRGELDEEMMTAISRETGGSYSRATDAATLEKVFERIDSLERVKLDAPKITRVDELFRFPLGWSLAFLALSFLVGETIWMRLPA